MSARNPDPAPLDARLGTVGALMRAGRPDDALAAVEAILRIAPGHQAALGMHAALLARCRRSDAADAAFRTWLKQHPGDGGGWLNYGHLLKASGRIDAAITAYRRALDTLPATGIAWWNLASLGAAKLDADDVAAMRTALATASDDADRTYLHFALARALGDRGDHEAAFAQLRTGNALRRSHTPHDADAMSASFRQTEAIFTPAFLAARANTGAAAADPIFIVGLPRSGSTLIEQILASHPLVEGTEELHDLHRVAGEHLAEVATLTTAHLRDLGDRYLDATRRYRTTDRPFFTDKMPSNWLYTGLIRLILPNARIVDVRRHPLACGFANYAQHYHWGNDFAYDLTDIGRFYGDYVRHMAHFDAVAPGSIHRVPLEALIADPEAEIRRLLDYLGLPFDPACLRFHENARAVHTPSTDQVRRPINRDGLDRWRAYEPWLTPLKDALGPYLDPARQP